MALLAIGIRFVAVMVALANIATVFTTFCGTFAFRAVTFIGMVMAMMPRMRTGGCQ
jgi:hypothetical protein